MQRDIASYQTFTSFFTEAHLAILISVSVALGLSETEARASRRGQVYLYTYRPLFNAFCSHTDM